MLSFFRSERLFVGGNPVRVMDTKLIVIQAPDSIDHTYVSIEFDNGARGMLDLYNFTQGSKNEQEIHVIGKTGKVEAFVPENIVCYGLRIEGRDGTDFMIEGTDEGNWDRIWYINKNIGRHVCSNKDLFGKLKEKFIVKKLQGKDKFLFIHGIGEINIRIGREIFCILGVQYTLDVTLNILFAYQLKAQRMDLAFKNNKCRLVYMFKDPENCKFDESQMKLMQNKYLSDYYKLIEENPDYKEGKSKKETILTQKCYRCEEIRHYAYACPTKTATVRYIPKGGDYVYVKGVFYPTKRNAWSHTPKINGIEIHLMDLYKLVECLGGYLSVYFAKEFGYIAEMFGLSYDYGEEIKECYNKYLDVFKCYYSTAKVPQLEQKFVQKKTIIFVDQGKELTCLQSHCGDQDQVTTPIGQDRICQEKNRVEHFGIELEDIEETKKCNQHQATYQIKTKDHFEKGSTSIAAKKDERDTSSSSSDDFIIIS
nr:ARID DNA-binding domain-containing protein [Tanacetum cinerariifolium]